MFLEPKVKQMKYVDTDLINLVSEILLIEKSKHKNLTFSHLINKIEEKICLRKKHWEDHMKDKEIIDDNTDKKSVDISKLFIIQSEVKPSFAPNGSEYSESDFPNKDETNQSISFSNIDKDNMYLDKEDNSMLLYSNNISMIQDIKIFDNDTSQIKEDRNNIIHEDEPLNKEKLKQLDKKNTIKSINTIKNTIERSKTNNSESSNNMIKNNVLAKSKQITITPMKEDIQPHNID